jgi:hypothetical protein
MKRLSSLLCFLCLIQVNQAQQYSREFGKTTIEELELQRYPKDTTAEALVLYDIGKSYFVTTDEGFQLVYERQTKIKILTKAGLDYAEFSIPYYEEKNKAEVVGDLRGNTYNLENGTVRTSELSRKSAYVEKEGDNRFNKKFAMPDVQVGSVIEVSYKIRGPFHFHYRGWSFQNRIPVIYSEYTALINPFYEYTYIFQGATKFDEYKTYVDKSVSRNFANIEYNDMVYFFVMKDVPAFKDEAFITSIKDYITRLDFQLSAVHHPTGYTQEVMTTWPKLTKELFDNDYFGKYLKKCIQKGKEITDTMQLASKPALEKAKYIERFVKSNFKWNGDNDKYASKSVKDLMISKTGNSADINLFLAGMLKSAGIQVLPLICSTRGHGKIKADYPFEHFFNYVLVLATIENSLIVVDATEPLSNFSEIPSRCLNVQGLILQEDKTEWVTLKSSAVSSTEFNFNLGFDQGADSIIQHNKFITSGYKAIYYRKRVADAYKSTREFLLGSNAGMNDSLAVIHKAEIEKPFELDYTRKTAVEKIEEKILVSPFCDRPITENPLKMPSRSYPVDFTYREATTYKTILNIPAGYKLFLMPSDLSVNNAKIRINYTAALQNDSTITVTGTYEFKKELYEVSDYNEVRSYFDRIVEKFNEKILLEKIK